MTEPTTQALIEQLAKALERIHLWADSQADAQSKGGHATFDLMHLREEREALIPALTAARAHLEQPSEPDCVGGSPCTTCADKQACATGCVRMGEFVGSPAPSTVGERDRTIVSLPIPASASDLKSDIAELIQSHK